MSEKKSGGDFRYSVGESKVPWHAVGEFFNGSDALNLVRFLLPDNGNPEYDAVFKQAADAITKLENVSVSDEELDAQMQMMSRYYGCKPRELRDMLEKSGAIDELRVDIINGKVLEKLTDAALA